MPLPDPSLLFRPLRKLYRRLPLPYALRVLLGRIYRRIGSPVNRAIQQRILANSLFRPPHCHLQESLDSLPDYLFWGVIDWDFRHQRPQHLAEQLSLGGRRVFYISSTLQDDPRAGFALRPLDQTGRLFEVRLFARTAPIIYHIAPDATLACQLRRSIGELLSWANTHQVVSLIQHPFWTPVAGVLPNSRVVYDCMDLHQGFGNNAVELQDLERNLIGAADLTLFASAWLEQHWHQQIPRTPAQQWAVLRNAADFDYFSKPAQHPCQAPDQGPVIGYYGALAHWFDVELLAAIAEAFPHCTILLIGADTARIGARLRHHTNVRLTGEVPYRQLSAYLHAFDVCILPFRIESLTMATNPVKVYEYLSAGKPVVTVDLPELHEFQQQVTIAKDQQAFIDAIARALQAPASSAESRQRQAFAAQQTWQHRVQALLALTEGTQQQPRVSVIVVTYNNLAFTRDCLASLTADPQGQPLEIIVVDNGSSDGSVEFLQQWATSYGQTLILNDSNRGFAAANNQGLALARGEFLALLNNDTQVTAGWARTLRRHLQRNPGLGLIGAVTNNIGNEAKIDIHYQNSQEMAVRARQYTWRHAGLIVPCATLGFFAVMMPRSTYERVGPLDEAFGLGFFEDDDYCRRVEQAGLSCAFAEDVFIHHHLSASFAQMPGKQRQLLFERNKALYEAKWGRPWTPHVAREKP
ncbi:Glycosyltransferase, GT2 family [Pseudomonas saponiphila]|uniref:Glycosyltransferase, GT2 family n=1 Tax=Pseudomonas saponiphila TaxID=556534 RepID=A0A1H4RBB0_9PSED|nr:Glycosyltransferase, GT2 family [Pseudomonas saponiphila]